jgi:hypothetical protein
VAGRFARLFLTGGLGVMMALAPRLAGFARMTCAVGGGWLLARVSRAIFSASRSG